MSDWILDDSWKDISEVIIYGFGRIAKANIDSVINDLKITAIVDNCKDLKGTKYKQIPIFSYNEYKDKYDDKKIIIMASGKALYDIKKVLMDDGKIENVDFTDWNLFVNEWYFRYKNILNLGRVTYPLTERCTFKCRDCITLMPYINNPKDEELKKAIKEADDLFALIDYVSVFDVIGGEPFLYPFLKEYIEHLYKHYSGKIGKIQIITNGSILPKEEMINTIKMCNVHIRISDYSNEIPYGKKVDQLEQLLANNNIPYIRFKELKWTTFGYPYDKVLIQGKDEILLEHMKECNGGMTRYIHGGKIYFCDPMAAADEMGLTNLNENDYLVVSELLKDIERGRKKVQEYGIRYTREPLSFCRYCHGYNKGEIVNAARQIDK